MLAHFSRRAAQKTWVRTSMRATVSVRGVYGAPNITNGREGKMEAQYVQTLAEKLRLNDLSADDVSRMDSILTSFLQHNDLERYQKEFAEDYSRRTGVQFSGLSDEERANLVGFNDLNAKEKDIVDAMGMVTFTEKVQAVPNFNVERGDEELAYITDIEARITGSTANAPGEDPVFDGDYNRQPGQDIPEPSSAWTAKASALIEDSVQAKYDEMLPTVQQILNTEDVQGLSPSEYLELARAASDEDKEVLSAFWTTFMVDGGLEVRENLYNEAVAAREAAIAKVEIEYDTLWENFTQEQAEAAGIVSADDPEPDASNPEDLPKLADIPEPELPGYEGTGIKVTVLGAADEAGQQLSLLLKMSDVVQDLTLFDYEQNTAGIAADLSHLPSAPLTSGFTGAENLATALENSSLVILNLGGSDFNANATLVRDAARVVASTCPGAAVMVMSGEINSTVPLVAEVMKSSLSDSYSPNKVFGVSTPATMVARRVGGQFMLDAFPDYRMPLPFVVGGASPSTAVPMFEESLFDLTIPNLSEENPEPQEADPQADDFKNANLAPLVDTFRSSLESSSAYTLASSSYSLAYNTILGLLDTNRNSESSTLAKEIQSANDANTIFEFSEEEQKKYGVAASLNGAEAIELAQSLVTDRGSEDDFYQFIAARVSQVQQGPKLNPTIMSAFTAVSQGPTSYFNGPVTFTPNGVVPLNYVDTSATGPDQDRENPDKFPDRLTRIDLGPTEVGFYNDILPQLQADIERGAAFGRQ